MMREIIVENLSYSYVNNGKAFPALQKINLEIQEGEFCCIVGHSGCGKSTLLRLLQGLLTPSAGQILLHGVPMRGPNTDRAIVFQQYSLFPWLRAKQQVMFGIRHTGRKVSRREAEERAIQMLDKVGMRSYMDRFPSQLSGGMQQRVAIARALAMDPAILLLDEPFGALDAKRRQQLQQLLLSLWADAPTKKTVVFVTHDIDEALMLADRIIFMARGKVLKSLCVPETRPRTADQLTQSGPLHDLKEHIMQLFDEEATDDEEII